MDDINALLIYKLTGGIVRRQDFAIDLAKSLIKGLYGAKCVDEQEDFSATADDKNWTVQARNRRTRLVSKIVIAKADAQVLQIDVPGLFSEAEEEMARWAEGE